MTKPSTPTPVQGTVIDPRNVNPMGGDSSFPTGGSMAASMLGGIQSEISAEASPLWEFTLRNAPKIVAAVLGIIVLIVGVGAWQWYAESNMESQRSELGLIMSSQKTEKRLAELEAFLPKAQGSLQVGVQMGIADAAMKLNNLDKAASAFQAVATLEKGNPLGLTASLNLSDVRMAQNKPAEALQILEALLPGTTQDLRMGLLARLAQAAEAAGNNARGVSAYAELLSLLPKDDVETLNYYNYRMEALK